MEEHVVQQGEELVEENFEGITEFNPEHIISDLGLRIPMNRFAPSIREEVRRVFFLAKGPTQSSGHNFPTGSDKRSFRKS